MSDDQELDALWTSILANLATDNRITPQLRGFLDLVEPRGIMAGVLYLEVPNELTRGMLEQRVRIPLSAAIEGADSDAVDNFAIVVNPDLETAAQQLRLRRRYLTLRVSPTIFLRHSPLQQAHNLGSMTSTPSKASLSAPPTVSLTQQLSP